MMAAGAGISGRVFGQHRPDRLDREQLLMYHDASGAAKPVRTVSEWLQRRSEILRGMQEVMGPLPGKEKRCPLDVKVEEEVEAGSHVRRLISYASEPGGRVPAYLLFPKSLPASGNAGCRGSLFAWYRK